MATEKVIGIDLGTTNSCMAIMEAGTPVVIPNAEGARTTPSVVAFTKEGERLVGSLAKRQAVTNPQRTVASIKRRMGTSEKVQIDDKSYTPAGNLRDDPAEAEAGRRGLSRREGRRGRHHRPGLLQRQPSGRQQRTRARSPGLDVLRIINEPTAAALAYGMDKENDAHDPGLRPRRRNLRHLDPRDRRRRLRGQVDRTATTSSAATTSTSRIIDWLVDEFRKKRASISRTTRWRCSDSKMLPRRRRSSSSTSQTDDRSTCPSSRPTPPVRSSSIST